MNLITSSTKLKIYLVLIFSVSLIYHVLIYLNFNILISLYEFRMHSNPINVNNTTVILLWTDWHSDYTWDRIISRELECDCFITRERNYIHSAEIVVFHWRDVRTYDIPQKQENQLWILFQKESPDYSKKISTLLTDQIDCVASYRQDSDIVSDYGVIILKDNLTQSNVTDNFYIRTLLENKNSSIVWPVSHCNTKSLREEYAKLLSKYISIDIYGDCGSYKCSRSKNYECQKLFERKYKFYLSFENSICKDYYTEKIINIMDFYIIPIVMGGSNYSQILPQHSYIDVNDFSSPQELSVYLHQLSNNLTQYEKYFEWKKYYQVVKDSNERFICKLCDLYQSKLLKCQKRNINQWWFGEGNCRAYTKM